MLKGSKKIIFDILRKLLRDGQQPTAGMIAYISGYHECTVKRALQALRDMGLIDYHQEKPGQKAKYVILQEVHDDSDE